MNISTPAAVASNAASESSRTKSTSGETQATDASAFSLLLALTGVSPQGAPSEHDGHPTWLFGTPTGEAMQAMSTPAEGTFMPPGGSALPLANAGSFGGYAAALAVASAAAAAALQRGQAAGGGAGDGSSPVPDALLDAGHADSESLQDFARVTGGDAFRATVDARGLTTAAPSGVVASNNPQANAAFEASLGRQLLTMARNGVNEATLELQPENLGKLDVRLKIDGDGAQLQVMASSAAVRDALDQAVPRLRDLFGDAGLDLGNVDIGHRDRSPDESAAQQATTRGAVGDNGDDADGASEASVTRVGAGLVDLFA